MKRPTFFLSSTIFDFADLRSAIKHKLELSGCVVLASEFNDFRKPLDVHSYEACLKAIEEADYFVLLIGTRVGGFFDEGQKISITRQEYRTALKLQQAGKLKIITLVRSEVWDFRENHNALERHLKSLNLETELARTIARYPTKFADDAAAIIGFIEEIARNAETIAATKGAGPLPAGNWIHVIKDFGDVVSVLNGVLLGGLAADEAAFRRTVRRELVELLSAALVKFDDQIIEPLILVQAFARDFPLTVAHREAGYVDLPTKIWDPFSTLMMALVGQRFQVTVLDQTLASPTFLAFDTDQAVWRETPAFEALFKLRDEVRAADKNMNADGLQAIFMGSPRARGGRDVESVTLKFEPVALITALAFRWANIVELACALVAHLDGEPFVTPQLMPRSPLKNFDEALAREKASLADVESVVARRKASSR